jgi:hypothetical protein
VTTERRRPSHTPRHGCATRRPSLSCSSSIRAPLATEELVDRAITARARFEEECARQKAEAAAAGTSRQSPPAALPDPDRERQLKALGYVD